MVSFLIWFTIAIGVVLLALAASFVPAQSKRTNGAPDPAHSFPYRKRDCFFSRPEALFYQQLRATIPPHQHIFPKVRLWDLVDITAGGKEHASAKGKVSQKHVDFVLCDEHLAPYLVIELDDASHDRPDRRKSDAVKDQILKAAGLPLLRYRVGDTWDFAGIAEVARAAGRGQPAASGAPAEHSARSQPQQTGPGL